MMTKRFDLILFLLFAFVFVATDSKGQSANFDTNAALEKKWEHLYSPLVQLSYEIRDDISHSKLDEQPVGMNDEPQSHSERSVLRAALFSAVIPGTGEFYNKSYLKGFLFLGVEVAAWALHFRHQSRGDEMTEDFEAFANAHWDESVYWQSLADASGCDVNNRDCLKEYEHASFSHFLPDTKNQTYYENIGKYDQFNAGWDDGSGELGRRDSENRLHYTTLRKEANDQFKRATLMASLAMLNHLVSAFDAGLSAHRHNKSLMRAELGMRVKKYDDDLTPMLSLNIKW